MIKSENRKRSSKNEKNPKGKKIVMLIKKECSNDNNSSSDMKSYNVENEMIKSISFMGPEIAINVGKQKWQIIKRGSSEISWEEHDPESNTSCPSKFLVMCLNTIQNDLQMNGAFGDEDRPLFANAWGLEFWFCCTNGKDVLDTNGADSKIEKLAWITSTAVDAISMKEREGLSFNGPFLLYLVPSLDKADEVLQVCKALETVGIQTVSVHSGASIDDQIQSLKSYEPEFLVSTHERLLELLSLNAVNISEVSLIVVDGLEAPFKGNYIDAVKSIRQFISGNPQTVVFC